MNYKLFTFSLICAVSFIHADQIEKNIVETSVRQNITTVEKQLNVVDQELQSLIKYNFVAAELEKIAADLDVAKKESLSSDVHRKDFLQKYIIALNKNYQIYTELFSESQQFEKLGRQYQDFLKSYDPDFVNLKISRKTAPSFTDLQDLSSRLQIVKSRITELEKNKTAIMRDIQKRKTTLGSLQNELDEKLEQKALFASGRKNDMPFTAQEQGLLIDVAVKQLETKRDLLTLKIRSDELQISFIDTQVSAAKEQLVLLKDDYSFVKRALIIDEATIKEFENAREEERQAFVDRSERLNGKKELLTPLHNQLKDKFNQVIQKYSLAASDVAVMREWSKDPKTIADWRSLTLIGNLGAQEAFLNGEREYLDAHVDLTRIKFHFKEMEVDILRSWQKMIQRPFGFKSDEALEQEIKSYAIPRNELQADLVLMIEKRDAAINLLHGLNISLDRIKSLVQLLKSVKDSIFKNHLADFNEVQGLLYAAEDQIRKRIDLSAKLIEVYATTIVTIDEALKKIEDVVTELTLKSFWRRSDQSIDWNELQNFVPDIERFIRDLKVQAVEYFAQFTVLGVFKDSFTHMTWPEMLSFIVHIIIALLIFALLRIYLVDFKSYVCVVGSRYTFLSDVMAFFAVMLTFISDHLVGLYVWSVICIAFYFGFLVDLLWAQLFYIISIPYLLFVVAQFVRYFTEINKQRNYVFMAEQYQRRFSWVFSLFCYLTIFILFFREAFLLGHYFDSQVPAILLALNFIILQIALISLISKDLVMSFIPNNTPLWEWIKEHIEKYYYALLIAVIAMIVMGNPYVGYGKQVVYVVSRLLLTILLIPLFSWVYNRLKHAASDLFFYYSEGEMLKERFVAGRNWYGLFVVISFAALVVIGIYFAAKVWGYSISPRKVFALLNYELYSPGINEATGKPIHVTFISLSKVVFFIIGGMAAAYITNQFVLKRIFDPLLLGPGVQNTILTFTRYIILVFAFLIGLQSAGLDALTTKLIVVLGAIGFALKEPLGDFFSYFIILVQRPIKIGDYILIDQDTRGIVRQITPRSTIIRRQNSVTLVVPNSMIVNRSVTNWNYTRTFFAFDDMLVTVPYAADPENVRRIILNVLDMNTNVLKNPQPIVWLNNFVDNGYQFLVRGYLTADKVLEQWAIASEIRIEIVKRLRLEGLEVASPTRSIKIVSTDSIEIK